MENWEVKCAISIQTRAYNFAQRRIITKVLCLLRFCPPTSPKEAHIRFFFWGGNALKEWIVALRHLGLQSIWIKDTNKLRLFRMSH